MLSPVFILKHYTTGFKNRVSLARVCCDVLFFFMHETVLLESFEAHYTVHSAFNVELWARGDQCAGF